jgi:uncharacterized membrane protein YuzA (DUF378 family)
MKAEKVLCTVALVLVVIGALNWGAQAGGFNLVTLLGNGLSNLLGNESYGKGLEVVVYVLVALSGVLVAVQMGRNKIVACPDDESHNA